MPVDDVRNALIRYVRLVASMILTEKDPSNISEN